MTLQFLELFALISWPLVALIVIAFLAIGNLIETDQPEGAHLVFVIAVILGAVLVFDWHESLEFAKTLPEYFGWFIVYLIVGAVWSVVKWGFFIRSAAKNLVRYLEDTRRQWGNAEVKKQFMTERKDYADRRREGFDEKQTEEAFNQRYRNSLAESVNSSIGKVTNRRISADDFAKEDLTAKKIIDLMDPSAMSRIGIITTWIMYWPISMLATLVREFIFNLARNIAKCLKGIYNYITMMFISGALESAVEQASSLKKNS